MTPTHPTPDFTIWPMDRLIEQRDHLMSILVVSAGQKDPLRSQLRAEVDAIRAEIERRRNPACPCSEAEDEECE